MAVKPIPDGYQTVIPYLVVPGVTRLLDFVKAAFGATVSECHTAPDGRVMHAEARIGDCVVMMGEPRPGDPPMPASLYMYVRDTDAAYEKALAAGASSVMAPANMFYGDRNAGVKDPCGNSWWIGTRVEDVAPAELERRAQAQAKPGAKKA